MPPTLNKLLPDYRAVAAPLLGHAVAFVLCFVLFVGVPSGLLGLGILLLDRGEDPVFSGEFLLMMAGAAALLCMLLGLCSLLLQLLRRKLPYPLWLPVLPALLLMVAAPLAFWRDSLGPLVGWLLSIALFGGFVVYWTAMHSSSAILLWFLRLLAKIAEPLEPERGEEREDRDAG